MIAFERKCDQSAISQFYELRLYHQVFVDLCNPQISLLDDQSPQTPIQILYLLDIPCIVKLPAGILRFEHFTSCLQIRKPRCRHGVA